MKIIIADAELELISEFTKRNHIFVNEEEDILERGKHRFILLGKDASRAGRPDIAYVAHTILSNYTKQGMEYIIHTRNNKIITWQDLSGAETYHEFKERVISILKLQREVKLKDLIPPGKRSILLSQYGRTRDLNYLKSFDIIVIGGFPEGDYISELPPIEKVSISERELTVPDVLVRLSSIFI